MFLLSLSVICLAACRQKQAKTTEYTVSHPGEITIYQYHDTTISLPVRLLHSAGPERNVSVNVASASGNIVVAHGAWGAIPDSFNEFVITCATEKAGDFPVAITATTSEGKQQASVCMIHIDTTHDCSRLLYGKYFLYPSSAQYIVTAGSNTKEIVIKDIAWPGIFSHQIEMDTFLVNCSENKITREIGQYQMLDIMAWAHFLQTQ